MPRTTVVRAGLLAVPATFALAACGAGPVTTTPAPSPSTTTVTATTGGSSASVPPPVAAAAGCQPAETKATLTLQPDRTAGTTRMALLELTNTSGRQCQVSGWVTVSLTDAAGQAVPVPAANVNQPGRPAPIDLKPGTSASAGIKWTACDKASPSCPTGNALAVRLPGAAAASATTLSGFPAPDRSDLTMTAVQLGTLQPTPEGVVAW